MSTPDLVERIEALSLELVMADQTDVQEMARLHTRFEQLAELAAEDEVLAEAAGRATQLLERLILGEEDAAAAMDTLGRVVAALRALVCEHRSLEEVDFPEGFRIAGPASGKLVLPPHVDEGILAEFLAQQKGVLEEFEGHVLALDRGQDAEPLGAVRRILHTLKGEAGVLGLAEVERVCHETESYLEERKVPSTDRLLAVKDWLARAMQAYGEGSLPPAVPKDLLESGDADEEPMTPQGSVDLAEAPGPGVDLAAAGLLGDFVTEAREHLEAADTHLLTLETDPAISEALDAVFRCFHTIKGVAGFLDLQEIGSLAHEAESLLDRARRGDIVLAGVAIDVTFDAVDAMKRLVGAVEASLAGGEVRRDETLPKLLAALRAAGEGSEQPPSGPEASQKVGELLVERGLATPRDIEDALAVQEGTSPRKKVGEVLVEQGAVPAREVAKALRSQRGGVARVKEAVKVDTERLDRLVDTIGELVIAESMVSQDGKIHEAVSARVARNLSQLSKITRELQELGMSLRMMPIQSTFQKMARMVRDLAKKAGKEIFFTAEGEDTELDRSVVERIGDPLIHLVRNAVDHGIEPAEERRAAGKPAAGHVVLRAFHRGGSIHVEMEDDGRGLDREGILKKAVERGLVQDGQELSDREVWNLIFLPGFSTAKQVTDVSGRGVGMDVVRRNIESLRGRVEVSSVPGQGSKVSMVLPLTLAIIEGMVVQVGGECYVIPTLSVIESIRPEGGKLATVVGRGEVFDVRGRLVPLFRLAGLFNLADAVEDPTEGIVILVEEDGTRVGLVVDALLGQQQTVIKSLGPLFEGTVGISGGCIMADGQVGLILDAAGLIKLATGDGASAVHAGLAREAVAEGVVEKEEGG